MGFETAETGYTGAAARGIARHDDPGGTHDNQDESQKPDEHELDRETVADLEEDPQSAEQVRGGSLINCQTRTLDREG